MAAPTPPVFTLTGFTKIIGVKPPAVEMGSYDDTIDTDTQQSTQANGVLQSTEMTIETRQDGTRPAIGETVTLNDTANVCVGSFVVLKHEANERKANTSEPPTITTTLKRTRTVVV